LYAAVAHDQVGFLVVTGVDGETVAFGSGEQPMFLLGGGDMAESLGPSAVGLASAVDRVGGEPEGPVIAFDEAVEQAAVVTDTPGLFGWPARLLDEIGHVRAVRTGQIEQGLVATLVDPPQDTAGGGGFAFGGGERREDRGVHPLG
jgi:hypothetical protein